MKLTAILVTIPFITICALPIVGLSQNDFQDSRAETNIDRVYKFPELDILPRVIHTFPTSYPPEAKKEKITGRVVLEFIITREGIPQRIRVVEAEPQDVFEDAAIDTLRRYRFSPGMKNGKAVEALAKIPIDFSLDNIGDTPTML